MKWDQAKYDRLRDELAAMESTRDGIKAHLQKVLTDVWPLSSIGTIVDTVDRMIENAAALRDALAPFDSRSPESTPQEPIPSGVHYIGANDNFYSDLTMLGMGMQFYEKWRTRAYAFPNSPSPS